MLPVRKHGERPLFVLVLLLLGMVISTAGIMAYSIWQQGLLNCFSAGYSQIRINEKFEPPEQMVPGVQIRKEVTIENTGPVSCCIRVLAQYTDSSMESYSTLDLNLKDWTKKGEYYYYNHVLEPGEHTAALFHSIQIHEEVRAALLRPFDVLIYAEAKQADSTALW